MMSSNIKLGKSASSTKILFSGISPNDSTHMTRSTYFARLAPVAVSYLVEVHAELIGAYGKLSHLSEFDKVVSKESNYHGDDLFTGVVNIGCPFRLVSFEPSINLGLSDFWIDGQKGADDVFNGRVHKVTIKKRLRYASFLIVYTDSHVVVLRLMENREVEHIVCISGYN